jgi:hypothetical protein
MSTNKQVYQPIIGSFIIPGWQVQALTLESARMMIELNMEKRGYWNRLREWTKDGKKVQTVDESIGKVKAEASI